MQKIKQILIRIPPKKEGRQLNSYWKNTGGKNQTINILFMNKLKIIMAKILKN